VSKEEVEVQLWQGVEERERGGGKEEWRGEERGKVLGEQQEKEVAEG